MYEFFKGLHSGFRYVVFLMVLAAIIMSLLGWLGKKSYTDVNRRVNLFALISTHTQLVIGIVLYFLSPFVQLNSGTMKNNTIRYFTVEHWVMMLLAIVLITIGYSKSKKAVQPQVKHKIVAVFYILAFLIVIGAIIAGHLPVLGAA